MRQGEVNPNRVSTGRYGLSGPGYLTYNPAYGPSWRRRTPD